MVPDNPRRIVQPGCLEPNAQGQCYIGMLGEKLPTPIEEARNQNQNLENDNNNNTDISEVEETEENWFNSYSNFCFDCSYLYFYSNSGSVYSNNRS
jgi:hypothetical protein